ncbi:hypothetical protein [Moorena sp. SIOASIH]|nr:hypothetical protein [Moorena sp. SIOASIH]
MPLLDMLVFKGWADVSIQRSAVSGQRSAVSFVAQASSLWNRLLICGTGF